jgi:hypothetical protein
MSMPSIDVSVITIVFLYRTVTTNQQDLLRT